MWERRLKICAGKENSFGRIKWGLRGFRVQVSRLSERDAVEKEVEGKKTEKQSPESRGFMVLLGKKKFVKEFAWDFPGWWQGGR